MKKSVLVIGAFIVLAAVSCSKKDTIEPAGPEVEIFNELAQNSIMQEDTLVFKVKATPGSSFTWAVNGKDAGATDSIFKFVSKNVGEYTIAVTALLNDQKASSEATITVYGKYKYGTFILNEGNMTSENGSLVFISPKGVITDSVYFKVNGTELGNVTQDLFIRNNKMYIIAQNGNTNAVGETFSNDGMLVVANAETLQKEASYNAELTTLSWPTHIAVLNDENVIIRDNKGLYRFNTITKNLTFIKGSGSAEKLTMAVSNNKIFAAAGKKVYVIEANKDTLTYALEMEATVSGVVKASDGNIWVSTTGAPHKISKINQSDYSVVQTNSISAGSVSSGWGATPGITAKGDTLYFSGAGTNIYRHIFTTGATEFMLDAKTKVQDANIVYNNITVHPLTGEVYMNTIKGYGTNYLINNLSVFNFDEEAKLSANYQNHTSFPAGIFFTYSFE
ncbi:DUF5074 domain-containing protein [Gynurincola endophyticus]|uniref:DUF5074 domain-containing protein n=1 Tax=Gynurincola endophyticus TaxID=2479004 RepID=UPI000F8F340E|nr:DUF5074 domain-containing protein [Gynurincola endophyticus]